MEQMTIFPWHIEQAAKNLALSAKVAYAPDSSPEDREVAVKYLASFQEVRDASTQAAVGLYTLITSFQTPEVKDKLHLSFLGVQVLQFSVTYLWSKLNEPERAGVKNTVLKLISDGIMTSSSPKLLQKAMAKLLVEIAKKEWPQLWPEFISFLQDLVLNSTNNKMLPFLVLQGLCEDVFLIQNINNPERRRDLMQGLQLASPEVITLIFMVLNLESATSNFTALLSEIPNVERNTLFNQVLNCLESFSEFIDVGLLTSNGRLETIIGLLANEELRVSASDCMIQFLERKGSGRKDDKRQFINICFNTDQGFAKLLDAYVKRLQIHNDEEEVWIIKLDTLITALFANSNLEMPNLPNPFQLLHFYAVSSSQDVKRLVIPIMCVNTFLRNLQNIDKLDGNEVVTDAISRLIQDLLYGYFFKITANQRPRDSVNGTTSENKDIGKLKAEFAQLLRTFGASNKKLYKMISTIFQTFCALPHDYEKSELENLVFLLEHFCTSVEIDDIEIMNTGMNDLRVLVSLFRYETDLDKKSILLSGISANSIFLSYARRTKIFSDTHRVLLGSIMTDMMNCFKITENEKSGRDLKRHVTSLLQKMIIRYPTLMQVVSDQLVATIESILSTTETGNFDYCGLVQVMLMISNEWPDMEKQRELIKTILSNMDWYTLASIFDTPEGFSRTVLEEHLFQPKVPLIIRGLSVLHSTVSRVKKRTSPPEIGGIGQSFPASEIVLELLPIVFKVIKTIHEVISTPNLKNLLDVKELEGKQVMGINSSGSGPSENVSKPRTHMERMQNTILVAYENCISIVGESCAKLSPGIYMDQQLVDSILNCVCFNMTELNNFRLRHIVRIAIKPFLISCPTQSVEPVLKKFFQQFGPYMMQRLNATWKHLNSENITTGSTESLNDDNSESESLENAILCLLVKDYLDLIIKMLEMSSANSVGGGNNGSADQEGMDIDNEVSTRNEYKKYLVMDVGDFGVVLLRDETCFNSIIHLSAVATNWKDSQISLKAGRILQLSWSFLEKNTDIHTINNILIEVLKGAVMWCKNEAAFDTLQKLVDKILLIFGQNAEISQTFLAWGVAEEDLVKMLSMFNMEKSEKRRKELFLKWTSNSLVRLEGVDLQAQWLKGIPSLESLLKATKIGP